MITLLFLREFLVATGVRDSTVNIVTEIYRPTKQPKLKLIFGHDSRFTKCCIISLAKPWQISALSVVNYGSK